MFNTHTAEMLPFTTHANGPASAWPCTIPLYSIVNAVGSMSYNCSQKMNHPPHPQKVNEYLLPSTYLLSLKGHLRFGTSRKNTFSK